MKDTGNKTSSMAKEPSTTRDTPLLLVNLISQTLMKLMITGSNTKETSLKIIKKAKEHCI